MLSDGRACRAANSGTLCKMENTPASPDEKSAAAQRYRPIKLRGGEPIHITVMRDRGHGSEHPQIAEWEASQRQSQGTATEEAPPKSALPSLAPQFPHQIGRAHV